VALALLWLAVPVTAPLAGEGGERAVETGRSRLRFEEIGERAGVRYVHSMRSFTGREKRQVLEMFTSGGAAVAVGDFDGDGFDDLFLTDSDEGKPNHLLRNRGDLTFTDVAVEAGVAGGNEPLAIVADALFFDYDNDGRLDLLVARFGNAIAALAFDADRDGFLDLLLGNYFQPVNLLDLKTYHVLPNDLDGDGTFKEVGGEAGVANELDGRGVGVADLDRDGRLDLVQTNAGQPVLLYHNRSEGAGNWVQLKLEGTRANRDAVGARVVVRAGGETFVREVNGGNGYASQSSTRLHFGLGKAAAIDSIEIRWPNGLAETLRPQAGKPPVPINAISKIVEGKGVL
jgi:hypothetical protein